MISNKIKKYTPNIVKLNTKLILRFLNDYYYGYHSKFASPNNKKLPQLAYKNSLTQAFLPSSLVNNKIENINLAAAKINKVIIEPNEVFSFWKIIGKPNKNNGYKKGRNIIGGKLQEDYGGGLCQLSGIIYHLSLVCNLEVLERFNHTIDLYTDENRYTPLGSDATVIYGYKDLRIKNNNNFPICFKILVYPDYLLAELHSKEIIQQQKVIFEIKEEEQFTIVLTLNENKDIISHSNYKK